VAQRHPRENGRKAEFGGHDLLRSEAGIRAEAERVGQKAPQPDGGSADEEQEIEGEPEKQGARRHPAEPGDDHRELEWAEPALTAEAEAEAIGDEAERCEQDPGHGQSDPDPTRRQPASADHPSSPLRGGGQ
jgi:hypothetical protein